MSAVLQRIEALPGASRYAVTFRRTDGGEQTAIVDIDGTEVRVAEANLPDGWTRDTAAFRACADALLAVHAARAASPVTARLVDVDGGWDVGLGNVVLDADGAPLCTAHGVMDGDGTDFTCAECGARARLDAAAS